MLLNTDHYFRTCTHTGGGPGWWRVDLDRLYKIFKVVIFNRVDCCGERIDGAEVRNIIVYIFISLLVGYYKHLGPGKGAESSFKHFLTHNIIPK